MARGNDKSSESRGEAKAVESSAAPAVEAPAKSGKVKLLVTYGGILIDGKVLGPGTEFEAPAEHVPGFLTTNCFALVTR